MVLTEKEKERISLATAIRCLEKGIPKQFWMHIGVTDSKAEEIWIQAEEIYDERTRAVNIY